MFDVSFPLNNVTVGYMFHELLHFDRYFEQLAGQYCAYSNEINIGRGKRDLFVAIVIVGDC